MGFLNKIFGEQVKETVQAAGAVIDNLSTSDQEKLDAKNKLSEILTGKLTEVISYSRDIIVSETQGNGLQRNWRPIVMLAFAFIIVYRYFIAPISGAPNVELPDRFFDLLELGLGGYVIGRSVEKVAETVTKNVDMSFLKKKDRK